MDTDTKHWQKTSWFFAVFGGMEMPGIGETNLRIARCLPLPAGEGLRVREKLQRIVADWFMPSPPFLIRVYPCPSVVSFRLGLNLFLWR